MATPRRPFVKVPLGLFEDALSAGISPGAALLLGLLVTHRSRRSIPGLLMYGPSSLAESITGYTINTARRALKELEERGRVIVDSSVRPPLLYVRGAVEADPPVVRNSVVGMAKQLATLPDSHIKTEVYSAVINSLPEPKDDKESLRALWFKLAAQSLATDEISRTAAEGARAARPESGPEVRALKTNLTPALSADRRSVDPQTEDPPPQAAGSDRSTVQVVESAEPGAAAPVFPFRKEQKPTTPPEDIPRRMADLSNAVRSTGRAQ
jgi:hypothetical protein